MDAGIIVSVDEVFNELKRKQDDIFRWARSRKAIFLPLEEPIQVAALKILEAHPRFVADYGSKNKADLFVIAQAEAHGLTVITAERPAGSLNKPRIPDICFARKVPSITLLQLMKRKKWIFRAVREDI